MATLAVRAEPTVTVFAAASLKDALDEVAKAYKTPVVISYGGSGMLARQVAQGAPADVVMLANAAWMDWLEDQGVLVPGKRRDLLSNRLVLVGPAGSEPFDQVSVETLSSRLKGDRLAIGQTQGVPAGIYGREWLENSGLWASFSSQLAETENVRAALALVARGETPLGLVYATDALAQPGVAVLYEVPANLHNEIVYPLAPITLTARASDFMAHLSSETASDIFRRHGFLVIGDRS